MTKAVLLTVKEKKKKHVKFLSLLRLNRSIRVGRRERAGQEGVGSCGSEIRGTRLLHETEKLLSAQRELCFRG